MTKKKLVQFGIVGALVVILAAGGFWAYKKGHLFGKADVLSVAPVNLTATIPGLADDVNYRHWAYTYIDAVFKTKTDIEEDETQTIMSNYPDLLFRPSAPVSRDQAAVYIARALNIPKCGSNCPVSFADVPRDYWAYPYIEALYQGGYIDGYGYAGANWNPSEKANVGFFRKIFDRANLPFDNPPGKDWDYYTYLTRDKMASLIAYNLELPGDEPYPSVYLQWDFPESEEAGFDFGYEVWREEQFPSYEDRGPQLFYVYDPPEQGLEEASDFGMFYDKDIKNEDTPPSKNWAGWYTYTVYLFNRDGEYSAPAVVSIYIDGYN